MAKRSDSSSEGEVKRIRRARRGGTKAETSVDEAAPVRASTRGPQTGGLLRTSIKERDVVTFLRQLIMLLEAGTPLLKALQTLSERGERASIRAMVADVAQFVEMGNPLWQAFERHPRQFDPVFVNLVKASEASGTLVTVITRLATYRERRQLLLKRIRGAMVYPVVLFLACFGVVILIGRFVIPEFKNIFTALEQPIPWYTQKFMDVLTTMTNLRAVMIAIILVVVLVILYKILMRTPGFRLVADRLKLWIPFVGKNIIRKGAVVELTQNLELLLGSGLSMMSTLDLVRRSIHNRAVGETLVGVRDAVERGEGIEQPLRKASRLVPPVVTDMLVTGEESGQLDKIAGQVAETYEQEVNISIDAIGELIPPALALFMGIFVLLLALSIFVPIISMMESLQTSTG